MGAALAIATGLQSAVQQLHSTEQSTVSVTIVAVQKLEGAVPVRKLSWNVAFVIIAAFANSGMVPVNKFVKNRKSIMDDETATSPSGIVPVN